jgi:hypothetical protein
MVGLAYPNDMHIIIANSDEAGTVDEELHNPTPNDVELAVETSSNPTHVSSSARGCLELCEQLTTSRIAESPT